MNVVLQCTEHELQDILMNKTRVFIAKNRQLWIFVGKQLTPFKQMHF